MTLVEVAQRSIWWMKPEEALKDTRHFLTYVLAKGTEKDIAVVLEHYSIEQLQQVLLDPLPGIFSAKAWNYWHLKLLDQKAPPLPLRKIPDWEKLNLEQ